MPQLSFCFQGFVSRANIGEALDIATGETVDIRHLSDQELVDKLEAGELAISLTDALNDCDTNNIELHDYEAIYNVASGR